MKTSALSALGRRTTRPPISWLMHAALSRPNLISLAAGFTDNSTLPLAETRALLNDLLRSAKTGRPALQYGTTAGHPPLRALAARHLQRQDGAGEPGPAYPPEQVLITSGSQQLLYLSTEALCDEGDIVLVEDPTYFVFLGLLQSRGLRARGVRLAADGLDLAHLETVLQSLKGRGALPRVKLLYLVSYFQNPTGLTTRFEKKCGLLELLKKFERSAGHPIYLLEDAAYRELRFAGPDVPSALAAPGGVERVIYAGTFTKPYATGARVGFGRLPRALFPTILHLKGNHDFGTSHLLQHLLARALATGLYDRHIARLRKRYAEKARVMQAALERHLPPSVEWRAPEGGLYFWARLPRRVSSDIRSRLFQAALNHEVLYVPGQLCYAHDPTRRRPNHEMRLSYGQASESNIRLGLRRLGAAVKKILDRNE